MTKLLALLLLAACGTEQAAETPGADVPSSEAPAAGATGAAAIADHATVTGTVLETMDAAGYTYIKLNTEHGEWWAAVQQAPMTVGQQVTLTNVQVMHAFESKSLDRTFDEILFATLGGGAAAAVGAASGDQTMAAAHGALAGDEPVAAIAVPKAEGADARTVAEVFAQKADLATKPVAIRGQVVKFNPDIMGKNWVHLRDGSGSDASADNDLTVTTMDTAAVGDIVTVRGVVGVDRDMGAGYVYAVMLEEATLEK